MDNMRGKKNPVLMKSKHRVQKHGEVFTPQWVVDKMMAIPGIKEKTEDVFATFLEPSAGEGAFLLAIEDKKLRFVTNNYNGDSWNTYALWALSSIYGIEFLEDNLASARQKMLELFLDYYEDTRNTPLSKQSNLYKSARTIIWANVVQGDTLTHKNNSGEEIVFSRWKPVEGSPGQVKRITFLYSSLFGDDDISRSGVQLSLFDLINSSGEPENSSQECYAIIDIELVWKEEKDMSEKKPGKFKFDVVIGNPPYQEETKGDSSSSTPIYHHFMEEAYKIAKRVSFITPARFLFNAGQTPAQWNKKMLEDEHIKVEFYERDSSKVFANTNIIGGVAVTYRDCDEVFGATGFFITFPALDSITQKVKRLGERSFSEIAYARTSYKLSNDLHIEYPEAKNLLSKGHAYDISTNIFDTLDFIFLDTKPSESDDYLQIYGIQNNKRVYKWVKANYIEEHPNLNKFKVFQGKSNGASGTLGDTPARMITPPIVMPPGIGHTQTFMSFGAFDTEQEAVSAAKYIRTKFVRVLLGVLKVTQDNPVNTWSYIPLQDFTSASDIDWTKTVREIDQQLYKKYGLDETEIEFIESHVKEME